MYAAPSSFDVPQVLSKTGNVRDEIVRLPKLSPEKNYSLFFAIDSLEALKPDSKVDVELRTGETVLVRKTLHIGDSDLYAPFHVSKPGKLELHISSSPLRSRYRLQVNQLPVSPSLKRGVNHRWEDASPILPGGVTFATSDEVEYVPLPGTPRKEMVSNPRGEDWYRLDFQEAKPKLIFFQLELTDRDNLPVDVSVFRLVNGKPQEYTEGQDPVSLPHEVQALPGNKFTPRVLKEKGTYYVRVHANHPEYKLRTRLYDVPPYSDPRQAVRAGVDYIVAAGDSWFANTPRRGGILDRISNVHQETSLCVGCHPSHFSQRAQLYAAVHGYPVVQREELKFLSDRFYNNPRPFYGFEQSAVWARVISAPANVLSRMSHLTDLFEEQVSQESRPAYHKSMAEYLKLYYADRDKLPADETNGNTPLVSAHEVAWYSWKAIKDPRLPEMIAQGPVKNMIDLCYQTLALADIDSKKYKQQLEKNVQQILSLQRPDGQWSMKFEPKEPAVEFQTGHALWALASAGVPASNPQVQKGIQYLLHRQQFFGGWMDPTQSFENFRTPFRETQMAILALSTYFPQQGRAKGWNSMQPDALRSREPVRLLEQLDQLWDTPSAQVVRQVEAATKSNEVLIRQAATEALGRFALPSTTPVLAGLLGDRSKLVQRTAAWSLRQIYSRHEASNADSLIAALSSPNARVRWGATRVFANHFSVLARQNDLLDALGKLSNDPVTTVRMQAIKGLWQGWFWNGNPEVRGRIEDEILAAMGEPQHPWIEQNLREAIYNLADENIRYLYNNWVPLLGRKQDQERVIRARLSVETQLADKFVKVLQGDRTQQKKALLSALNDLTLRRGDVYELNADLTTATPPVYSRIGNDIEQIAFFGPSADRLSQALLPLMDSPDPEMKRLAQKASLLVRETPYTAVDRIAGSPGVSTKELARKIDQSPETSEIAKAFHVASAKKAKPAVAASAPQLSAAKRLDEAYFRAYVQPILQRKGKDGYACINCHASHTLFNATWSTVKNVVDLKSPENSLLLRKPISSAESEGVAGSSTLPHGGGIRWAKGSPEYETILKWIEGATLQESNAAKPR